MYLKRLTMSAIALSLGTLFAAGPRAYAQQGPPPPGFGWDAPPQELNEIQRHGFHEGIEAAHKDIDMNRNPDVGDHEIFRHPHLPPEQREAFRDGFRRGYGLAMAHLTGRAREFRQDGPPQEFRTAAPPAQWDTFPAEFNDIQRRGFHDGIEGARRDFESHRPLNVDNREEFRHPHLPPEARAAYQDGYRHGYDRAREHLMGQPSRY